MTELKLEAGKFYRSRDWRKVGPMKPWAGAMSRFIGGGLVYPFDGLRSREWSCDESTDLVAEWSDEPAVDPKPVYREGDEIDLRFTLKRSPIYASPVIVLGNQVIPLDDIPASQITRHAATPRQIKVGDLVLWNTAFEGGEGTVLAIDGDEAWVRLASDERRGIYLDRLRHSERAA